MFEATTSGFMLVATDGATLVCSTSNQAKVLLIAIQELHVWPIQIYASQTIRRAVIAMDEGRGDVPFI